ncbi:hypothetical protein GCM10009783_18450 [Glycomyces lechevalierae]
MMRPCLGSPLHPQGHTLTPRSDGRCADCARVREADRTRGKRATRPYTHAMVRERKQTVDEWKRIHGDVCPGWDRPPHPTPHLTADHPLPVAAGGDENQKLEVLCRSCNGRKGSTPGPPPRNQGGTPNTDK